MTPLEYYQQDLQREDFQFDAAQELAVKLLDDLYQRLIKAEQLSQRRFSFLGRLLNNELQRPEQGLYLWGGVGRGKTYLVDVFYNSLPFERKMRVHFHRFMKRIHCELKAVAGQKNPMILVAERLAKETRVLCFDEFFVSDITDAMILAELMKNLFDRGVSLVATSNIPPSELYKGGLQRVRFLPAIDLIKTYTDVYEIDSGIDYRLRVLEQANLYHSPLNSDAEKDLKQFFYSLVVDQKYIQQQVAIEVLGRDIVARFVGDDVVWFDFAELCDGPRSQNDYIELAREYHAVIVSGVPQLSERLDDQARRFISLIDEFYDHGVKLAISAAVPLLDLYSNGTLEFEFQRTLSRLQEMQSTEYLECAHSHGTSVEVIDIKV